MITHLLDTVSKPDAAQKLSVIDDNEEKKRKSFFRVFLTAVSISN